MPDFSGLEMALSSVSSLILVIVKSSSYLNLDFISYCSALTALGLIGALTAKLEKVTCLLVLLLRLKLFL